MSKNNISFILHRPQLSENIGACARAIKNFNFKKLILINPKPIFPNDKIFATSVGAKNIINQNSQDEILGNPDKILFEHPSEDEILIKINEIKDYFTTPSRLRDYNKSIELLSEIKPLTDTFFDQVKVNSENQQLKKNRLELLYLMCKTFDKFTDFSKLDGA